MPAKPAAVLRANLLRQGGRGYRHFRSASRLIRLASRRNRLRGELLANPPQCQHDCLLGLAPHLVDIGVQLLDELRKSNSLAA